MKEIRLEPNLDKSPPGYDDISTKTILVENLNLNYSTTEILYNF